ncbi:MAG TPA: sigma 54-interacting transcriptional regulator [Polyangiaceae bacterium]|nr:sigma 54-interacting transcriptional regulator [Polyangiaceae bacterium]
MKLLTLTNDAAHSLTIRAKALVFEDPKSRAALERLRQVAPSDATVLVTGETGTGKEIVARHVHDLSPRRDRAFVPVNCGALTESLVESELFGHERGAFTGAISSKPGWFEAASGGTLFLDEVGDLPLSVQVKLLRVLQEGEVVRVGSRRPIPVDVRLIAATNVLLEEAVAAGHFREDLFYRLNVASLALPPLRERPGDILPLALYFVNFYQQRLGLEGVELSTAASERLLQHAWPGNIRELENVIHHALLVSKGRKIAPSDLRLTALPIRAPVAAASAASSAEDALAQDLRRLFETDAPNLYDTIERVVFCTAFDYSDRNQLQTARLLGISRNVVRARLSEYGELTPSVRPPPPAELAPVGTAAVQSPQGVVKIGYQRFGLLPMVRAAGGLDALFSARGWRIDWVEYPGGIQIVEALQANGLALASVGEGPPVFAHAASVPLLYLAAEAPAPEDEALIVRADSALRSVRDLAGCRIALNRGANVHYLLIRALEEAGVAYDSVEVVYLTPHEARAAFERGDVDAWAIWAPLLTELIRSGSARVLRDASGLADNAVIYIANPAFAAERPELVEVFFGQLAAVAALLAPHRIPRRVDETLLATQQAVADAFHRHQLISHQVRINDTRWLPPRVNEPFGSNGWHMPVAATGTGT